MNRTVFLLAAVAICIGLAFLLRAHLLSDLPEVVTQPKVAEADVLAEAGVAEAEVVGAQSSDVVKIKNRPVEVLAGGYISASTCTQRCHQQQFRSWHHSYHRTMTQKISPESAIEAIDEQKVSVDGLDYEFIRKGDRYFVRFDDPIEPGPAVVEKELVLMTGSHHMSVFWYESPYARTPAQLPIVYLRDQKRWIPRNAAFIRPHGHQDQELGRWNLTCSRCHSTYPRGRLNEQTSEWDTHVVDFGIACEACHGPGENHIRFHDNVEGVQESDDVVISPEDVPHKMQSDVCGQCHSTYIFNFDDEDYGFEEFMTGGMPFRPGDNLEDSPVRTVIRTTPESKGSRGFERALQIENLQYGFWSDGTVRVSGREFNGLIESSCYKNGTMSCLSCHEMHPDESVDLESWRDDQLKPKMRTNHACTQCHQEPQYTSQLTQHTHHAVDSHGSNCMNCHMPHTTYGLLKSIRSHRIENPSVMTTLTTTRPNGCVLCHLDRPISWVAENLTQWYGHQEFEFENPVATETASGLVNYLLGDAGQRAIHASAFAWEPAREASGTDWMAPYLIIGMLDEYDAVRIISKRTLQTLPGYEDVDIDELADVQTRGEAVNRYLEKIKRELRLEPRPELMIKEDGKIDFIKASKMFNSRDRTPMYLQE